MPTKPRTIVELVVSGVEELVAFLTKMRDALGELVSFVVSCIKGSDFLVKVQVMNQKIEISEKSGN